MGIRSHSFLQCFATVGKLPRALPFSKGLASLFDNLPWYALRTEHAGLAISAGAACRYRADVAPFAATTDNSADAMLALIPMLEPGELVYLMGAAPAVVPGLIYGDTFPCLRMAGPERIEAEMHDSGIVSLTCADAPAMVALTDLAFPGFFRPRTCEMGDYFGIFEGETLIAMGGERLCIPGWHEISGVCTRPGHTGKGYAARLIARLLHEHVRARLGSFLHVSKSNTRAICLYSHLGFSLMQEVPLYPVSRDGDRA